MRWRQSSDLPPTTLVTPRCCPARRPGLRGTTLCPPPGAESRCHPPSPHRPQPSSLAGLPWCSWGGGLLGEGSMASRLPLHLREPGRSYSSLSLSRFSHVLVRVPRLLISRNTLACSGLAYTCNMIFVSSHRTSLGSSPSSSASPTSESSESSGDSLTKFSTQTLPPVKSLSESLPPLKVIRISKWEPDW